MAMDYSVYQSLYTYMNSVLGQLQSLQNMTQSIGSLYSNGTQSSSSLYSGGTRANGLSFGETFQNAAGRLGVPESMDAIFQEAAEKYNVPVKLLMAVGKAESGYNADAVSSAGAQGVMQLMPATAAALGVEDAFDARSNIMGGARYLAQKLQQYNGDIDLTLAAYNAGSGNVAKYGGVPPFEETINYISRIKGYMGQELTTGQTVSSRTGTSGTFGASGNASGRTGTSTSAANSSTATDLTQQLAEYFVGMMRLQMMSRVSSLGKGTSIGSLEPDSEYTSLI